MDGGVIKTGPTVAVGATDAGAAGDGVGTGVGDVVAQESATRNGVLAAAAEVNGAGDGGAGALRPPGDAQGLTTVATAPVADMDGELLPALERRGTQEKDTDGGDRGTDAVRDEVVPPPASMAEVRIEGIYGGRMERCFYVFVVIGRVLTLRVCSLKYLQVLRSRSQKFETHYRS